MHPLLHTPIAAKPWYIMATATHMQVGYIDDRFGPMGLAAVVVLALTAILIISIVDFVEQLHASKGGTPSPPAGPPLSPTSAPGWLDTQRPSLRSMRFQGVQQS